MIPRSVDFEIQSALYSHQISLSELRTIFVGSGEKTRSVLQEMGKRIEDVLDNRKIVSNKGDSWVVPKSVKTCIYDTKKSSWASDFHKDFTSFFGERDVFYLRDYMKVIGGEGSRGNVFIPMFHDVQNTNNNYKNNTSNSMIEGWPRFVWDSFDGGGPSLLSISLSGYRSTSKAPAAGGGFWSRLGCYNKEFV